MYTNIRRCFSHPKTELCQRGENMQLSSKQQIVEAGRKAVEKARKAVGNINAHEADFGAKRKDKNKNIDDIDE